MEYAVHYEDGIINRGNYRRLKDCMKKARAGKPITVGFLGGSITQGCNSSTPQLCYAYLVYQWWVSRFPDTPVTYVNAGIGATTSQYGVARVDADLLSHQPDFVLIEFAVNDNRDAAFFEETYEGLVRKTLSAACRPALVLSCNVRYDDGSNAEEMHLRVAKAYEVPMVSMKQTIWPLVARGEVSSREITTDDLHPNDTGHALVARVITTLLDQVYAELDAEEAPSDFGGKVLPDPITLNAYETSNRFQNDNSQPRLDGFVKDERPKEAYLDIFSKGWTAAHIGDAITFRIEGTGIAVQYRKSVKQPTPVAKVVIDGDEQHAMILDGNFDETWGDCLFIDTVATGLEKKTHEVKLTITKASEQDAVPFYLVSVIGSC